MKRQIDEDNSVPIPMIKDDYSKSDFNLDYISVSKVPENEDGG
jgi:hypothetical protein